MTTATQTNTQTQNVFLVDATTAIAINQKQLVDGLLEQKGATPISLIVRTIPDMRKTNNPFVGKVHKVAKIQGMVNFNYDAGVLRRLEKEGKTPDSFEKGESWHEPVKVDGRLTPLCKHKTKPTFYLRFMLLGNVGDIDSEYRWNDDESPLTAAQTAELKTFIRQSNSYSNQGLDNPLVFLTYGLDSIKVLTINGKTYIVG